MSGASISFPALGDWSIDPSNHFVLFGHTFYWYGVIIACGFLLAVLYCFQRSREFGIRQDDLLDTLLFAVPLGIVGARAYYVIFYGHYDSFLDMCKIWEGGLAIYGAVIAAVLTVLAVCRVKKISPLAMLDLVSFGLLIGQSIGRWGNFMNREAYGYETDIFCRMGLTLHGETIYVHPTFLYESLWNLLGFLGLHILSKKTVRKFDGQYFLCYLGWYGLGRVWIEGLRSDSLYIGGTGVRVSQLLAGLTLLAAVSVMAAVLLRGKCGPEKLWVNRAGLLGTDGEETPAPAEDAAAEAEEPAPAEEAPAESEEPAPGEPSPAKAAEEAAAAETPSEPEEAPAESEEEPTPEDDAPAEPEEAPVEEVPAGPEEEATSEELPAEPKEPAPAEEAPTGTEEETPEEIPAETEEHAPAEEAPAAPEAPEPVPAVKDFDDVMAWMDQAMADTEAVVAEALSEEQGPEKKA